MAADNMQRPPSLPSIPDLELDSFHMDIDTPEDEDFDEKNDKAIVLLSDGEEESTTTTTTTTTSSCSITLGHSSSLSSSSSFSQNQNRILPHKRSIPLRFASPAPSASTVTTRLSLPGYHLTPQPSYHHPLPFSLPPGPGPQEIYESYTITYHHPVFPKPSSSSIAKRIIPLSRLFTRTTGINTATQGEGEESEPGRVLSVVPNPHFSQDELRHVVQREYKTLFTLRTGRPPSEYTRDLEMRLRAAEWKVQDEIYDLLNDRCGASSTCYKRREWRVVMLVSVEGGEMVDHSLGEDGKERWEGPREDVGVELETGGSGLNCSSWRWVVDMFGCGMPVGMEKDEGRRRRLNKVSKITKAGKAGEIQKGSGLGGKKRRAPITEYRLVIRGKEVSECQEEGGWRWYNRYSRPWREVDDHHRQDQEEKKEGVKRRWSGIRRSISSSGAGSVRVMMGEKSYVDF
ncbi:hypothetical protein QBC43DRAFT_302672 [Cladorrhinum sp. PSN259]|nr:hypothetical protein QBC43DRAFT_302672 [Cladorrhinum sp. PSN259]